METSVEVLTEMSTSTHLSLAAQMVYSLQCISTNIITVTIPSSEKGSGM